MSHAQISPLATLELADLPSDAMSKNVNAETHHLPITLVYLILATQMPLKENTVKKLMFVPFLLSLLVLPLVLSLVLWWVPLYVQLSALVLLMPLHNKLQPKLLLQPPQTRFMLLVELLETILCSLKRLVARLDKPK